MRLAIFSDVHGNLTALEAVLADIGRQAPDAVLFAGDLCLMGARPAACLDAVRATAGLAVYGNTDAWLTAPPPTPAGLDGARQARWRTFQAQLAWTRDELGEARVAWLARLPFAHRLSPTPAPADDLVVVHANPADVEQPIFPTPAVQQARTGSVSNAQPDEALQPLLDGVTAAVIAFGHVHFPNVRPWSGLTLANISAVSLPQDGDPRARYGLLTWRRPSGWTVASRAVAYDVDQERAALEAAALPEWQDLARRLAP